jgi:AraC-like DNA-binding protein
MHFHFSFYSSLLLIFFTQGLLFTILLLRKGYLENDRSSYWLAAFIFLCSCYILPWMLGHAGWYSLQPYRDIMFFIPFQQLLLMGPVIYYYTITLLNPGFRMSRKDRLQFLPGVLYLFYALIMFLTDKIIIGRYYFYADGRDRDLDTWYQITGLISMSFYLVLSLRYYAGYRKLVLQVLSFADQLLFVYIKRYLIAFLLMQVFDLLFFLLYPGWGSFTSKWWYYFIFSGLFYYIALSAYASNIRAALPFDFVSIDNRKYFQLKAKPVYLLPNGPGEETDTELPIAREEVERLVMAIEVFKDPEITLPVLAKQFNTNPTALSRAINKGFGKNFNDFINQYRVEAVKKMILAGEHKRQTLLGIAFECGFNSKNTFNRAFKKQTGFSPREYIARLGA